MKSPEKAAPKILAGHGQVATETTFVLRGPNQSRSSRENRLQLPLKSILSTLKAIKVKYATVNPY